MFKKKIQTNPKIKTLKVFQKNKMLNHGIKITDNKITVITY